MGVSAQMNFLLTLIGFSDRNERKQSIWLPLIRRYQGMAPASCQNEKLKGLPTEAHPSLHPDTQEYVSSLEEKAEEPPKHFHQD